MEKETLVIDLDNSFFKTDTLFEEFFHLIKNRPLHILIAPFWLLRGILFFKEKIYKNANVNYSNFPVNQEVEGIIREAKGKGKEVYLVSASLSQKVETIAGLFGYFDGYAGSDQVNLKGKNKLTYLESEFPSFSYLGDSYSDLEILNKHGGYLIDPSFLTRMRSGNRVKVVKTNPGLLGTIIKQIRVHQWVKNFLIFVPLILSHNIENTDLLTKSVMSFFSFSFMASMVYVLNDLLDLEADRAHFKKKKRPFASGNLPLKMGFFLIPTLLLASLLLASYINTNFFIILLTYFVLTTFYSFYLKKLLLFDVICLACLFTIRVFAGGLAIDVKITNWLLIFSLFFFFGLAMMKRYVELLNYQHIGTKKVKGRGYFPKDLSIVGTMGSASSLFSILVYCLYITTDSVETLYSMPDHLFLMVPIFLFYVARMWILASRGEVDEDPIVFTLKDSTSYFIFIISTLVIWSSI